MVMLFIDFLTWWYGPGWKQVASDCFRRMSKVADVFSVPILLRTLFAPWRRIITYPGAGLDAKIRALGDNLVSRCIGFTVRFLVLIAAAILIVLAGILGLAGAVLWPLVPLLIVGCIGKGVGLL